MSRPSWLLRDAALGYAARGIPVLPLHYSLVHRGDVQALIEGRPRAASAPQTRCSCRDPGCGQPAKHPLGALVPHGVKDATTNRARVLAWWTGSDSLTGPTWGRFAPQKWPHPRNRQPLRFAVTTPAEQGRRDVEGGAVRAYPP